MTEPDWSLTSKSLAFHGPSTHEELFRRQGARQRPKARALTAGHDDGYDLVAHSFHPDADLALIAIGVLPQSHAGS